MPSLFPFLLGLALLSACSAKMPAQVDPLPPPHLEALLVGAERTAEYLPLLQGKRVAVVTNQTGRVGAVHLVDTLVGLGVRVTKVFAPEHGFRGDADAGEQVKDGRDAPTGLPLVSLYGDHKKPRPEQLQDVDVLLFDIQDVGVRFYTYISTLHYVMEAAADAGLPVIVLDRPNPNGFYVDGPVLDPKHRSFVGLHPVPLVHGMTVGEFARMIAGEGWLGEGRQVALTVIPCTGYDHRMAYAPPVRPSPNLPNLSAVMLYPALGLFEGTVVSVGRGTDAPFQCIGFPGCTLGSYRFTPRSMPGAKEPPFKGQECTGLDLSEYGTFYSRLDPRLHLGWLIGMYQAAADKDGFFNPFFDKLAGGPDLRERIRRGETEEAIRASWKPAVEAFRSVRARYLLYPEGP
ncbi:MAG: DUF1343 domain-containing protein [Flavobacteriales bacterium]|nr:DUF1343 domain-containing protein [Flavobacteriales bacterium]MBK7942049.1 DUF1343 domain-containing protein [Flavobacteriales bacterium]MBK9700594.1 DUF1343 domain-containing protein [Flavobacteriales bacterium]